jgi:colanic acid/amylovoran biosynthesis glycosyltransferase
MTARLAYIMSRFPHLPETFILREMIELERQGWEIALYPLILQDQSVMHAQAAAWKQRARYLPYFSGKIICDNIRELVRAPFRYVSLWRRVIAENWSDRKLLLRALLLLPKAFSYARWMQRDGITHIHAHFATHPALVAWLIHQITAIPYSVTVHAHDIYVHKAMLATKLRDAAFIAAISEFNRQYLAQHVGAWAAEKTEVIHCGIEPQHYFMRSLADETPRRGPLEIINIGSLQPYKGQIHLVEACVLLKERGIEFRCRIIGGGEEQQRLAEHIRARGLEGLVILEGPKKQDEVAHLLPLSDCYIQPSIITSSGKMEGIPVALMEAMACRLPCIATDISGVSELVRHETTGLLVAQADPAALANAIERIYLDPHEANSLAQAGYDFVMEAFQLCHNVERLSVAFKRGLEHS